MGANDWVTIEKPYNLRERLLLFACLIVKLVQFLHTRGSVGVALSEQILRCGTSAGANFEEADDGSSSRDKIAKQRIALRELKETLWRLRVARRSALLTEAQDPLIAENIELIKIVATIIRRCSEQARSKPQSQERRTTPAVRRPPQKPTLSSSLRHIEDDAES